jgi:hypothetical protein
MSRSKLGLLSLCAIVVGLMAFAGSAHAAEWVILNSKGEVKTATELNASVVGELEKKGGFLTKFLHTAVKVVCSVVNVTAVIVGTGKVNVSLKHTGCEVETPSGCTVHSPGKATGTIESNKLKGQLESNGETKIEPETGETLANLVFEGATCTLPTEVNEPIKGVLWIKDCEFLIETHLVKHLVIESTAHGKTLFIGSDTAEHLETALEGSTWVKLSGAHAGLLWGATLP